MQNINRIAGPLVRLFSINLHSLYHPGLKDSDLKSFLCLWCRKRDLSSVAKKGASLSKIRGWGFPRLRESRRPRSGKRSLKPRTGPLRGDSRVWTSAFLGEETSTKGEKPSVDPLSFVNIREKLIYSGCFRTRYREFSCWLVSFSTSKLPLENFLGRRSLKQQLNLLLCCCLWLFTSFYLETWACFVLDLQAFVPFKLCMHKSFALKRN